jgi:hypothetical protein
VDYHGARITVPTESEILRINALPYDLEETELDEYKNLDPRQHDWQAVKAACSHLATVLFDRVCDREADRSNGHGMAG